MEFILTFKKEAKKTRSVFGGLATNLVKWSREKCEQLHGIEKRVTNQNNQLEKASYIPGGF